MTQLLIWNTKNNPLQTLQTLHILYRIDDITSKKLLDLSIIKALGEIWALSELFFPFTNIFATLKKIGAKFGSLDPINLSLTVDNSRGFCRQCRSRSDCTECAVWSLIYTIHIFILDYNWIVSSSIFSQWKTTIQFFGSERIKSLCYKIQTFKNSQEEGLSTVFLTLSLTEIIILATFKL